MSFLNPWAFLGLLTLPAIVAMHLHLERNRRVIVSSMFLWAFLDEKFQGKTPKFIRISWLLLLDLGIAALLTLALARPVLQFPSLGGGPVQQIILLDDSASMLALDGDPDRFSLAQDLVISLIEVAGRESQSVVFTIGGDVEMVGATREIGERQLVRAVEDLSPLGLGVDLRAGLAAAQSAASSELPVEVYVISDAAFDLPPVDDFPLEVQWVFIGFEGSNQAVVDPQLGKLQAGQRELFFRLANFSGQETVREVELSVDGEVVRTWTVTLAPRAVLPQVVRLTGQLSTVQISLLGSDLNLQDDTASLGVGPDGVVQVAVVAADPMPLDRAVSSIPNAALTLLTPEEYIAEMDFDLVIFRGVVPERWPEGVSLVFDPPPGNALVPVGGLAPVGAVTSSQPAAVLDGVDLAGVRWGLASQVVAEDGYDVLARADRLPLLLHLESANQDVYILTPELTGGNFTKHPAFPILLSNLVELARPFAPQSAYLAGERLDIGQLSDGQDPELRLPDGGTEELTAGQSVELSEPGLYRLTSTDQYGEPIEAAFGVNLGNLDESDITPREWRSDFVEAQLDEPAERQSIDVPLGPWLLAMAVVLLALEAWRAWR